MSTSRLTLACALVCTALMAWLSQATIAFTGTDDARVALFPLSVASGVIAAAAAAAVFVARRSGASLAPLWLLALLLLPWLSPSLPVVFQVWSGPMALLVWTAVALAMGASMRRVGEKGNAPLRETSDVRLEADATRRESDVGLKADSDGRPRVTSDVRLKADATAALLACVVYAIAAWQVAPSVPGADEPHYLIITQSLLKDGDLRIENNHRNGDYHAYYAGELSKPDFRRRGQNGEIYSIHAPGLPAIVAPVFAVAGYHGVVLFLILATAVGTGLAWHLAWVVTRRTGAAWFGWAAVALSTPQIFHSFAVYPDGVGGVLTLTGIRALVRGGEEAVNGSERTGPWWLHGALLAILPWLHTRFALLAGSLGALILWRLATTRNAVGKAVAFLVVPAISALCWIGFFVAVYGTPDPSAPYGNESSSIGFIPGGIAGLLFDQRFGVLTFAPVLAASIAGLVVMVRDPLNRRLGLELLFVLIPYLLAVTDFAMWWGGRSAPARFLVPVLLTLTIPAAAGWSAARHRATRVTLAGALVFTVLASAMLVFVGGGRLAFNERESYAFWLEWVNGTTDLAHAVPSWWRGQEITRTALYRDAAIWLASLAAAWGALRSVERAHALRQRGPFLTAAAAAYAVAGMLATSIVWTLSGTQGTNTAPAQLAVLRRLGTEPRLAAFTLAPFRRVPAGDVPPMLSIEPPPSAAPGGAGPNDRPLYQVPLIPAGQYRLRPRGTGTAGWLMIGIGRDQFSIRSGPLATPPDPIVVNFPVDVRAVIVRADEQARRTVRGVTIEPLSIVPPSRRLSSETARRAVRYPGATVFFLDDRSFPEPEGFWIGGGRTSSVVVQPAAPSRVAPLVVRNGPVENAVVLDAAGMHEELRLVPGEERHVDVPIDPVRGATLLTIKAASGFRPSEGDPRSRDARFLGAWIKIE